MGYQHNTSATETGPGPHYQPISQFPIQQLAIQPIPKAKQPTGTPAFQNPPGAFNSDTRMPLQHRCGNRKIQRKGKATQRQGIRCYEKHHQPTECGGKRDGYRLRSGNTGRHTLFLVACTLRIPHTCPCSAGLHAHTSMVLALEHN